MAACKLQVDPISDHAVLIQEPNLREMIRNGNYKSCESNWIEFLDDEAKGQRILFRLDCIKQTLNRVMLVIVIHKETMDLSNNDYEFKLKGKRMQCGGVAMRLFQANDRNSS